MVTGAEAEEGRRSLGEADRRTSSSSWSILCLSPLDEWVESDASETAWEARRRRVAGRGDANGRMPPPWAVSVWSEVRFPANRCFSSLDRRLRSGEVVPACGSNTWGDACERYLVWTPNTVITSGEAGRVAGAEGEGGGPTAVLGAASIVLAVGGTNGGGAGQGKADDDERRGSGGAARRSMGSFSTVWGKGGVVVVALGTASPLALGREGGGTVVRRGAEGGCRESGWERSLPLPLRTTSTGTVVVVVLVVVEEEEEGPFTGHPAPLACTTTVPLPLGVVVLVHVLERLGIGEAFASVLLGSNDGRGAG